MGPHRRANNERIREYEQDPLWRVLAADHNTQYQDPNPVNGHIPDYKVQSMFGETRIGETEQCGDNSAHSRKQRQAFSSEPGVSFELNEFGCDDSGPELGLDVDLEDPFAFGWDDREKKRENESKGLLDWS